MPRYYFDVTDIGGFHHDEYGEDFAGLDQACLLAQSLLYDIARDELPGSDLHTATCDVRDEAGRVVYRGEITYRGTPDPG